MPFPATINLSFHLAFCVFFNFLLQARFCSSWFLSELWHLLLASVVSLFQVWLVLQAAGPLSGSLPSSFLCMSQQLLSWRHLGRVVAMCICCLLHCTTLFSKGLCLVSLPHYSWRRISVPCCALFNFLVKWLCIVSLLGYVRISVWLKVSVEEETEMLCLIYFIL